MAEPERLVLRKGLDLPIPGAARPIVEDAGPTRRVGLLGSDHPEIRVGLRVSEGDRVASGETLFVDRRRPEIRFVSPAAGRVHTARPDEHGRAALVVVETEGADERPEPAVPRSGVGELLALEREALVQRLLELGAWPSLRERPFDRIPDPDRRPDALLLCLTDTRPLAPPFAPVVEGREDDLETGIAALSRLSEGPTFVCGPPGFEPPTAGLPGVRAFTVAGPHPSGLPGTQIHHLFPIRDGRRVWHVGLQDTLAIGRSLRTGRHDPERVVALAGPMVRRPRLLRTRLGASIEELVGGELLPGECRVVSGSPLSGRLAARAESYLGRHHHQVSVLSEREDGRSQGWLVPFLGRRLRMPPWRRPPSWSTERHGAPAAMLSLDVFDAVAPLRLPIALLLRALAAGDLEVARRLGALELVEEDLALCSYLCPAKLEYGELLRKALDGDRAGAA